MSEKIREELRKRIYEALRAEVPPGTPYTPEVKERMVGAIVAAVGDVTSRRFLADPGLMLVRQIRDVTIIEVPDTIPSIPAVPELVICQECAGSGELDADDLDDAPIECCYCDGRGVVPRGPEPDDEA